MPTGGSKRQQKACYNCRRRRLRCDRSVPTCLKCSQNGETCLGYSTVLRWATPNAPAGRGSKLTAASTSVPLPHSPSPSKSSIQTEETWALMPTKVKNESPSDGSVFSPISWEFDHFDAFNQPPLSIHPVITDPLLNGLSRGSRYYVHHFTTTVCRDMVSIDQPGPGMNPFRGIIPLVQQYDYLQQIVVAVSAMHLARLHRFRGNASEAGKELVHALAAKGKAIRLLRDAVASMDTDIATYSRGDAGSCKAVVLAAIVFFINLDLIDSGKGKWRAHVQAARSLISSLQNAGEKNVLDANVAGMVDAIAADCLTYHVLGSTISVLDNDNQVVDSVVGSDAAKKRGGGGVVVVDGDEMHNGAELLQVLRRAEAYSYHCCPPDVLSVILATSQLTGNSYSPVEDGDATSSVAQELARLFHQARTFDVWGWIYSIANLPPDDDLEGRFHVASAHRAACCLYILLSLPPKPRKDENDESAVLISTTAQSLVHEILDHLASIPTDHVHLKGTVWPTFMVGAQTDDPGQRSWCLDRLSHIWTVNPWMSPWGYVQTAMELLQDVWTTKDASKTEAGEDTEGVNWLQRFKAEKGDCLIV